MSTPERDIPCRIIMRASLGDTHVRLRLVCISALSLSLGCACGDQSDPAAGSGGNAGNAGTTASGTGGTAGTPTTGGAGGTAVAGTGGSAGSEGVSGGAAGSAGTGGSAGSGGTGAFPGAPIPTTSGGTPTRPVFSEAEAAPFTVLGYLARAGNVTAPIKDDWDPTAGVGDTAGFTPTFEVEEGGTHETVQSAVDAAVAAGGTERVFIRVAAGTYREVVCVPSGAPPITLYGAGDSPDDTLIVFDNYNGKAKEAGEPANPCNPSLTSTTFGTSGSATFAAYAAGFQAKNLTIANDTEEAGLSSGTQAVALMTQGDKIVLDGVRLLANQDTLYAKTPDPGIIQRIYVKDSYIEGDVDFIFGRATLVLDGCTIHYLTARQASKGGYLVAPSTDARNPFGILIHDSELTAEEGTPASLVFLGRAWDESQTDLPTYATNIATGVYPNGQVVIRNSTLGAHVSTVAPWAPSTIKRPYSSVPTAYPVNRFFEFANDGPGAAAP